MIDAAQQQGLEQSGAGGDLDAREVLGRLVQAPREGEGAVPVDASGIMRGLLN